MCCEMRVRSSEVAGRLALVVLAVPFISACNGKNARPSTGGPAQTSTVRLNPAKGPRGVLVQIRASIGSLPAQTSELSVSWIGPNRVLVPLGSVSVAADGVVSARLPAPAIVVGDDETSSVPPLGRYELVLRTQTNRAVARGKFEVTSAERGRAYPFRLETSCGITGAVFDGNDWAASPSADAPGAADRDHVIGKMTRVDGDRATFDAPAVHAEFGVLAPGSEFPSC